MLILPIFLSVLFYCIACTGLGDIAMRVMRAQYAESGSSSVVRTATRFLLGQGLLANFWVLLALADNFSPTLVKGIIVGLILPGGWFFYKILFKAIDQAREIWREWLNETLGWKLVSAVAVTTWLAWLTSIGRKLHPDGTSFYLALAKVISASERLVPLPGFENLTSIGLQGEMHYAVLMIMGSPDATQVFGWLTFTTGCLLLFALGRQAGLQRRGQWLVLVMVFTSSAVIELSGSGKTDHFAAAFALAAYFWAFQIGGENRIQALLLTGLFGGLAVVAKLSYIVSLLPSLIIILTWRVFSETKGESLATRILPLVWVGISTVLIAIILPIKNQVLFENPLAPFGMTDIFEQTWYGPDTIQRIFLSLPFALTFGEYWAQIGGITPLVLMFLPMVFFLSRPQCLFKSPSFILGVAALIGLATWFIFRPAVFAPRYFLGCLLLLTLPAAMVAERFAIQSTSHRRTVQFMTIMTTAAIISYYSTTIFVPYHTLQIVMSGKPDCELDNIRCEIIEKINPMIALGERVFTNDPFRYWLRPDTIQCALTVAEMENYLAIESPEQSWRFITGRGFDSILIYNRFVPLAKKVKGDLENIPDWLEVTKIKTDDSLIFVKLKDNTNQNLYICSQQSFPAWDVVEIVSP